MRNKRKRQQREEVRKILHTMRLELAAQRVAQEQRPEKTPGLYLNELIANTKRSLAN